MTEQFPAEEQKMLETENLILDKAEFTDWEAMYQNVWSHPECARYMLWNLTESEDAAKERILRTIEFQKDHDGYLVYEKASGSPIGFAGVRQASDGVWEETGICLGPAYQHKGYGKQILTCLMGYCRDFLHAHQFLYSTRAENLASCALARSLGFTLVSTEVRTDTRTGQTYTLEQYRASL